MDSRTPIAETEPGNLDAAKCSSQLLTIENSINNVDPHLHHEISLDDENQETTENHHQKIINNDMNNMCTSSETPNKFPVPIYVSSQHSCLDKSNKDDDDSVSSLDSCDDATSTNTPTKRSIFGHNRNRSSSEDGSHMKHQDSSSSWTERTSSLTASSRCSLEATMELPDEFAFQEFNRKIDHYANKSTSDGYEQILKNYEVGCTTMPRSTSLNDTTEDETKPKRNAINNSGNHRSLFKNMYSLSSPSLAYVYRDSVVQVKKTSSTSSLRKKHPSCLKSRSLSIDSTAIGSLHSSCSKLSVSFDSRVFVHEYEKPCDRYTDNGWSKWFV